MTFIDSLVEYKKSGEAKFDTTKPTASAIVKELLPTQLTAIKKNFKEFVKLITLLKYYTDKTIPKLNTKVMLQSYVRKLVKEAYGEGSKQYYYLKSGFSMTDNEKQERTDVAESKVVHKNENQIIIHTQQIIDFKNELLTPKFKIVPAIILAQLASGCRLIEILSDEFTFKESCIEKYILQNNVAKNKSDEERPVEKPIIFMSPKHFIELVDLIREKMTRKADDTNVSLSNRYDKRVNAYIKKLVKQIKMSSEISTSHDMRKIYANYSYKLFSSKACSLQGWLSKVLGHDSISSASANYSTLKITKQPLS